MSDDYYILDNESLLKNRSSGIARQSSLVRPERNSFKDPRHPQHYYAQKVQETQVEVNPSSTGVTPGFQRNEEEFLGDEIPMRDMKEGWQSAGTELYGGADGGRNRNSMNSTKQTEGDYELGEKRLKMTTTNRSLSLWEVYCYAVTFWAPAPLMRMFGIKKKASQMAWREKIALISIILYIGAFVAFLTFGFSRTVCNSESRRIHNNEVSTGNLIIHGNAYALESSTHPEAAGITAGSNVLYPPISAGGMDASFLFQNVNGNCKGLINPRSNSTIPYDDEGNMAWYFPCRLVKQDGSSTPNFTESEYYAGWACHTSQSARDAYYGLDVLGEVYFTWDEVKNSSRELVVYDSNVLDLAILDWLETDDLTYPEMFDFLRVSNLEGYDISLVLSSSREEKIARCLVEIAKVGVIDSETIGCIASQVVLYLSLIFILSVVLVKFFIACYYRWFVAGRQGAFPIDNKTLAERTNQIEDWSENIESQGPLKTITPSLRPKYYSGNNNSSGPNLLKSASRSEPPLISTRSEQYKDPMIKAIEDTGITTMTTQALLKNMRKDETSLKRHQNNRFSRVMSMQTPLANPFADAEGTFPTLYDHNSLDATSIHPDIVLQPPPDYMPFGYPLIHTVCFVTCYSEDESGLRTTLDSIACTDYPNSHKLIMVVCDGLIKGSGNDRYTSDIVLDMMEDYVIPREKVEAYPYVAVASGAKRHNMAKVYAGFYKYDDSTTPIEKQQRVPIITIVKCGAPEEQASAKPGNRGKRDSQIILMSFLQKITFDERMAELEYQMLKNIWRITGLMATVYETVLMVDADTKVFPDSLTHMIADMVRDPTIMGLCGETKIANKKDSWVTAIQVFEYFISHHQSKAFESVFGSVTCLPGCFSIYRIKTPKGNEGFWVPILANPDIVERYSDNVTNTVHEKNLLLLGEDRFLSTLMLKTFPKRKCVFLSKAACKTVVPDTFKVLLSQRRRWINSTIHNLMDLVLVRDLCGTFCFSMQFVIFMELIGTVVLPIAICFTVYVVVFAIISQPTPIVSLVMLAVILGLPGVLIVVTATRWSYLLWMFCYLIALPVWNFILPTYSFWKFDDFSWGETRTTSADGKGKIENAGEFDHSKIKMRTWREYERAERTTRTSDSDSDGELNNIGPSQYMDLTLENSNDSTDFKTKDSVDFT